MNISPTLTTTQERRGHAISGWFMLLVLFALLGFAVGTAAYAIGRQVEGLAWANDPPLVFLLGIAYPAAPIGAFVLMFICLSGFFTLQPNEAAALVLFGSYRGTVRKSGFFWANPFLSKNRISLRMRNLNGERLKVNDKRGNPIEIAAVVVWRVHDTAKALFDVDNFERYVAVQSEAAVRHLASSYAYDDIEETAEAATSSEPTLRTGGDQVAAELAEELKNRLARAGVTVEEARLTHLAYAPEIAQAMLRRQQAEAVIAARQKIVHGAVSMVEMALKNLSEKNVVVLDDERKAAMVSNLLVVLCGETEVHPVVNAGTLYS